MPPRNSSSSDRASRVTRHPYTAPLARDDDPATSAAAADRVSSDGTVDTHERLILAALRAAWPKGLTGTELAARVGLTQVQVMRRVRALLDRGAIHRLRDHRRQLVRRDGQTIHCHGRGDMLLFPDCA